jgi:hypothetical protein
VKCESEPPPLKRIKPEMVDIEIQDIKAEIEAAKKKKAEAEVAAAKDQNTVDADKTSELNAEVGLNVKTPESSETEKGIVAEENEKSSTLIKTEIGELDTEKVVQSEEEEQCADLAAPDKLDKVSSEPAVIIKEEPKDKDIEKVEQMEVEQEKEDDNTAKKISEETEPKDESLSEDLTTFGKSKNEEAKPLEHVEEAKAKQTADEEEIKEKEPKKEMPEKETIRNEEDESKGSSTEMNEVQVEIKNELKITIKLPAEKMNRVEVQVKGSPKFSVPDVPPPPSSTCNSGINFSSSNPQTPVSQDREQQQEMSASAKHATFLPKFDPFSSSDGNNIEALGSLLNQMNPIRWPRDRAVQIRLEHIVHAVEKNEWPVSRFFSSASMIETFDYTPQGTPDAATPVRDTPTPISECSDLAPPEDLIMSLPSSTSLAPATASSAAAASSLNIPPLISSTSAPTVERGAPSRRGRRRRIAIDVETERAKLQALLSQSMHGGPAEGRMGSGVNIPHVPSPSSRLSASLRRERNTTPTRGLNMTSEMMESEAEARNMSMSSPAVQKDRGQKFQPPPPAHQNHALPSQVSLLRNSHQQQQQSRRSQSPSAHRTHRASPGYSTQSQSSTLDLSIKSSHKDVAAAAMSALSSLSSVTVTPVTLPSPSMKHSSREREGGRESGSGLTISSAPMDLSGG